MPLTMLCVQFRNLLPSEDLLLFARALWECAQREGLGSFEVADATLSITKTESKVAPFEASLRLGRGSLPSVATGVEPLTTIEAAFAQLCSPARSRLLLASLSHASPRASKLGGRSL
jgi:hypothetical protein